MVGIFFSVLACSELVYFVLKSPALPFPTGGTIVILVPFFCGIQLLSLGIMAEYVGRIYDEVKRRPRFILESSHDLDKAPERARTPRDRRSKTVVGEGSGAHRLHPCRRARDAARRACPRHPPKA